MSPEKQREIASKGGQSVPAGKRSFAQNRELRLPGRSQGRTDIAYATGVRTLPEWPYRSSAISCQAKGVERAAIAFAGISLEALHIRDHQETAGIGDDAVPL